MNIGLIGFGEVGGILATDLKARGADVAAWDLLMAQPAMREKARAAGIEACESSAALVRRSQVVISAVTASNTLAAAREATYSAVSWGIPTPATMRVVQIDPGPCPTLMAFAPQSAR